MPGEEVTVRLALVGSLPCTDGEVEFRFPLTVAPRLHPGGPHPAPPEGAAAPDAPAPAGVTPLPWLGNNPDLTIAVDIHPAGLGVSGVRSSLPAALETGGADDPRRVVVQYAGVPACDFVLRYRVGAADVRAALQLLPDGPGE